MQNRGYIEVEGENVFLTEAGIDINVELSSIIASAETDAEAGLDYELRQTLKYALNKLLSSGK